MLFRFEDLAAPPEISSHANRLTPSIWYHSHLVGCVTSAVGATDAATWPAATAT